MMLELLDVHKQENAHQQTSHASFNSEWITDLDTKPQTVKFPEVYIEKYLCEFEYGKTLWNVQSMFHIRKK